MTKIEIQSVIDSKINELIRSVFAQRPSTDEKNNNECVRCGTKGVVDSHTIPKSLLSSIASNDEVSMIGFTSTIGGGHTSKEVSIKNASTYPLFCHRPPNGCEQYFAGLIEERCFDIKSKEFILSIMASCERLIHAEYYKLNRIFTGLQHIWGAERDGFETVLNKSPHSSHILTTEVITGIDGEIKTIINHVGQILNANYKKTDLLNWAERIRTGEEEEFAIFIQIAKSESDIPWRVGDLKLMINNHGNLCWCFVFNTKVLLDEQERVALVLIPIVLNGEPGTPATEEERKAIENEITFLTSSQYFSYFSKDTAMAMTALSFSCENFWFPKHLFNQFSTPVIKASIHKKIDDLVFDIIKHRCNPNGVEQTLNHIAIYDDCRQILDSLGGTIYFKAAGIGWQNTTLSQVH